MMMKNLLQKSAVIGITVALLSSVSSYAQSLWKTALNNKDVLVLSTLFTAQDCRDKINTAEGLEENGRLRE